MVGMSPLYEAAFCLIALQPPRGIGNSDTVCTCGLSEIGDYGRNSFGPGVDGVQRKRVGFADCSQSGSLHDSFCRRRDS
jgi:hypothetical protein